MLPDKVRIKKFLRPEIEEWCKALDIPPTRFIDDAIIFYLRHLKGVPIAISTPALTPTPSTQPEQQQVKVEQLDPDEEDFDGGIEL